MFMGQVVTAFAPQQGQPQTISITQQPSAQTPEQQVQTQSQTATGTAQQQGQAQAQLAQQQTQFLQVPHRTRTLLAYRWLLDCAYFQSTYWLKSKFSQKRKLCNHLLSLIKWNLEEFAGCSFTDSYDEWGLKLQASKWIRKHHKIIRSNPYNTFQVFKRGVVLCGLWKSHTLVLNLVSESINVAD